MICSYPDIPISVVIIEGRGVLRWARNRELRKFNKVWILKSDFFFLVFKWFRLKAVHDHLSIHLAKIKLAVLKTLTVVLTKQWSMQYNLNLFLKKHWTLILFAAKFKWQGCEELRQVNNRCNEHNIHVFLLNRASTLLSIQMCSIYISPHLLACSWESLYTIVYRCYNMLYTMNLEEYRDKENEIHCSGFTNDLPH